MNVKRCLLELDHLFTERAEHMIEQLRYGKGLDFSVPGESYKDKKDYVRYQATVFVDRKIIRYLSISKNDSILDIGCGKGKMVYYFSKKGFGRSDGIEFSKELVSCARNNMKILKKKCSIINADAVKFCNYSSYNYFYLFNPFGKETMSLVIHKIEESYKDNPRKIIIIYHNPLCHIQIIESGFFHLKYSDNNNIYRKITGRVCNIYENEG